MLIAEEYLLLITSPEGKWLAASDVVPLALAGGLLAELAVQATLSIDERGRVVVRRDHSSPDDPLLAEALTRFADTAGEKPEKGLRHVAKGLSDKLYQRLIDAGVVEVHKVRLLPVRHYPLLDPLPRQQAWNDVADVLRKARPPQPRTATLLGLIAATGAVTRVFPPEQVGLSKHELTQRARAAAQGDWATDAVGRVVRDVQAATTAAITAATTAATIAGGSS